MPILERLDDGFSRVLPSWKGRTVAIFGGGPSLTLEQVERVGWHHSDERLVAIGVNDAFLWASWVDVLYAADSQWWLWTEKGTAKPLIGLTAEDVAARYAAFNGERLTMQNSGSNVTDLKVHKIRNASHPHNTGSGISLDPTKLVSARASGYQAINLAILAGVARIILLGYDGRPNAEGKTHWFGKHPVNGDLAVYEQFRRYMSLGESEIFATGVEVLNCSPGSAYDNFPKMDLREALQRI